MGVAGIKKRMDVIASCGKKVVFSWIRSKAGYIKLTKNDSPDDQHHFIPLGWVERVDGHVHLIKNSMETEHDWQAGVRFLPFCSATSAVSNRMHMGPLRRSFCFFRTPVGRRRMRS